VIGTASLAQSITIINNGDLSLTSIAATATGDYSLNSGCGNSLAGHTSCVILVTLFADARRAWDRRVDGQRCSAVADNYFERNRTCRGS
jgi:hypothetical protein